MIRGLLWLSCYLGLLWLPSACALTSKADAMSPRYFSPERAASSAAARGEPFELRLGQVASASHLDERISYRINDSEVGFYEDRRWTEMPEDYLRRALERELFERRGLSRIVTGTAPTLEVELTAFEELRGEPTRVRVTLSFTLRDERRALVERSLNLEREAKGARGADEAGRVASALATTLSEVVQSVAEQVVAELATRREPSATATPP